MSENTTKITVVEEGLSPVDQLAAELVEVGDFGRPRDEAELQVNQVITAVSLGLAPIVDQADHALRGLSEDAGEPLEKDIGVRQWVEAVIHRELLELRAAKMWPYPVGTRVQCDNEGRVFEAHTTSGPRAMPDRTVLVDIDKMAGGVMVQSLKTIQVPAKS